MSTYVRDKLNRYLRKEKPNFVKNVKVSEILPCLPCLTPSDKEEIEAKLETKGNRVAVSLLLDCLVRRENWPEELISALEECEQCGDMAAEMRRVYYSQGNPRPNAPAAHVHLPPPVSIPESVCNSQAAVVPPPLAPQEPAAQISSLPAASALPETPAQLETPPSLAAEAASSSDPAPQAPQSPLMQAVHRQATPPASPETPQHQTATTSPSPPPVYQEPEENSDVDLQVVSGDKGPGTNEGINEDSGVSGVSSEETPDPEPPVRPLVNLHAVAATSQPYPVQTATPEVSPPQSSSLPQTDLDETDESTCTIMTPEKSPVQETVPPKDEVASTILEPEEHSDPIATQNTENGQHSTVFKGTSTLPADCLNATFIDEDDVQLSKPGPLLSCQLVSNGCQVEPGIQEATYSGTSSRLEMSDSVPTTQVSAPAVPCSRAVHRPSTTTSPLPCQENGVVGELLPHNEPEENQYESPCHSFLEDHSIMGNVVHVSEPPSIQNQDGQTPSLLGNLNASETKSVQNNNSEPEIANESSSSVSPEMSSHSCEDNQGMKVVGIGTGMSEGQETSAFAMEPTSAPELPAAAVTVSFNAASNKCHPSKSKGAEVVLKPQDPVEEKPFSSMKSYHTKYLMTAAGVCILAMLMLWKLKR